MDLTVSLSSRRGAGKMKVVFLIGAARSGTKLLRDVLAEHPKVGAVPFDINYLWRVGQESAPDDVLNPPLPSDARKAVQRELVKVGSEVVVEKTVSNCLRVPAIASAFPEAHFIFLVRDGYDVTESSIRQWQAPVDWRYSVKKAMAFPWLTAPGYAFKHLRSTLMRAPGDHVATWGPRYRGIDDDVSTKTLAETCARQWSESVSAACSGLDQVSQQHTIVRYRDFVHDPLRVANELHAAIGLEPVGSIQHAVQSGEVGKGRRTMKKSDIDRIHTRLDTATRELEQWIASS